MKKKNTIKLSVRVDMETYNRLCKVCKENESISEIVREYINIGLGIKTTADDIDKISEIIRNQVESVCEQPLERLIKIVIKNIKSSEASKYILCSMLKEFSQENTDEIIEKAERQAIVYATNRNS
ncbi:MAG TPA: hypothetical protein IAC02_05155 [Candidatus Coprovivens excrementavium]|nr:hypothetical protein [Candidatus Coprovivens excrementavium]